MIPLKTNFTIPFTRIIILCSATSIISSLIILYQAWWCVIFVLLPACISIYRSRSNSLVVALCIIAGLSVFIRIQQIQGNFRNNISFLEKPLTIQATLLQLQHNNQERPISTLLLQTIIIYDNKQNKLTTPKIITVQIPYKRAQKLKIGQRIAFHEIVLQQPPVSENMQDNPYLLYLMKEGIWASAYVSSQRFNIVHEYKPTSYQQTFNDLSNRFNVATKHLYNPLFLGKKERDYISLQIQHQSLYWGIAHHMARSGIHLVTLLGLCMALFHYARIRNRLRFGLYAILMCGYTLISIPSISFIRSLIMIMIQMFSKINGFQYSGIHAFALTTLIIVQHNPLHVLFLDFQLSFGITAVIIWLFYVKWAKTVAFSPISLLRC